MKKPDIPVFYPREASEYRIETFQQELARKKSLGTLLIIQKFQKRGIRWISESVSLKRRRFSINMISTIRSLLLGIVPASSPDPSFSLESWLFSDEWHDVIDAMLFKSEDIRTQVQNFLHLTSFSETTLLLFRLYFSGVLFFFFFCLTAYSEIAKKFRSCVLSEQNLSFLQAPFLLQALLPFFFLCCFGTIFFYGR